MNRILSSFFLLAFLAMGGAALADEKTGSLSSASPRTITPTTTQSNIQEDTWQRLIQGADNPRPQVQAGKRFYGSGLLALDEMVRTRHHFTSSSDSSVSLSIAKLNFDGLLNPWVQVHGGVFFSDEPKHYYPGASTHRGIDLDEGYVRIANFQTSPFYLSMGRQYLPFGQYRRYPVLMGLTQALSEIRQASVQAGFIGSNGFYGGGYVFQGKKRVDQITKKHAYNGGATIGYAGLNQLWHWNIGIDYLWNMADIGRLEAVLKTYSRRIDGISTHLNVMAGPFDGSFMVVGTFHPFAVSDYAYQVSPGESKGARPRAFMAKAGYRFKWNDHNNKISFGYQISRDAYSPSSTYLQIPWSRASLSYGIALWKYFLVEFEIGRDRDYGLSHGGTDRVSYCGAVRFSLLWS